MKANLHSRAQSLFTQGSCRVVAESSIASVQPPVQQNLQVITENLPNATRSDSKRAPLDWILALSVVKFDIDKGNIVEAIYPADILTKPEEKTLSLLSFPDSNAFSAEGTLKYVFRFRRGLAQNDGSFASLFGYVHFIQKKDPSNSRGFSQKSIVILSALPFCEFFKNILDILAKSYREQEDILEPEQYLKENFNVIINEWPRPQPGFQHELCLNGNKLAVSVPKNIYDSKHVDTQQTTRVDKLSPSDKSSSNEDSPTKVESGSRGDLDDDESKEKTEKDDQSLSKILCGFNLQEKGSFQDINLYKIFKGEKLPYLWKLWELVLTNQPMMIVSDLPSECSEAVLGLLSVIYPIEYQTDYKPYFTIYDPEYREIQSLFDKKMAKCAILGVTNPLFLRTMPTYPNIFHLEADFLKQKNNKSSKKPSFLESTQKFHTLPDPSLKQMLMQVESEEADAINNALLRKSLQKLTEGFLSVFQLYFKLQINDIKKFEEKDFMNFLELQKFPFKSQFSSQAHILKLYAKFLKSANFQQYIKTFPNVYLVKNV